MKKRLPTNFTDLILIALIAWFVKDFGNIIDLYLFRENESVGLLLLLFAFLKALIGSIIFFVRMKYNS